MTEHTAQTANTETPTSATLAQAMARLSPKKARFVAAYVAGASGKIAVQQAGWNTGDKGARSLAWKLLHQDAAVMAAVDVARKEAAIKAEYGIESARTELDESMSFARETKNATAYVRAVELKAKLFGLLVERQDVRNVGGFRIQISDIDNGAAVATDIFG